jgi:hypothetical protein
MLLLELARRVVFVNRSRILLANCKFEPRVARSLVMVVAAGFAEVGSL